MSAISYTDGIKGAEEQEALVDPQSRKEKTMTMMMSLIIFVVVMMFGAWSSAYIVSMSSGYWASFDLPAAFNISTGIIVFCSVGIYAALYFAKRSNKSALVASIVATFVLSIVFGVSQFNGWGQMVGEGDHLIGGLMDLKGVYGEDFVFYYKGTALIEQSGQFFLASDMEYSLNDELAAASNTASSYFYVFTFMHLLHVALGMGLLIFILVKALKGRYNKEHTLGVKLTGMYWHFMGGLWIYIMLFLHFIH